MILSGKLFPAAFVEVMLLQGKIYFHAIKKMKHALPIVSV